MVREYWANEIMTLPEEEYRKMDELLRLFWLHKDMRELIAGGTAEGMDDEWETFDAIARIRRPSSADRDYKAELYEELVDKVS